MRNWILYTCSNLLRIRLLDDETKEVSSYNYHDKYQKFLSHLHKKFLSKTTQSFIFDGEYQFVSDQEDVIHSTVTR